MSDAASWTERHAAAAMAWDTTPNQLVVAACRKLRPGRALDLGAGEGANSMWLARRGWQVTAIDSGTVEVGRIQSHSYLMALFTKLTSTWSILYLSAFTSIE